MKTTHQIYVEDARNISKLDDNSVDLVVTSPPYPMIEMWDDLFSSMDESIQSDIESGNDWTAYEKMHSIMDNIWEHFPRIVRPNGIVCINIGDATRTIDGKFTRYPNHETISEKLRSNGLEPLTNILWRKPTNSPVKYMGSGMRPPNAYVTLEHEYILLFRNGKTTRSIEDKKNRNESAYFMEERNEWFSDLWTDINGINQSIKNQSDAIRSRSAAYPIDIPHRLVNMYSVHGDTVLDPFWGTGTTTYASMLNKRNSIGFELNPEFVSSFNERIQNITRISDSFTHSRLMRHKKYIEQLSSIPNTTMTHYNIPVVREQQKDMKLYTVNSIEKSQTNQKQTHEYNVTYELYSLNSNQEKISTTNYSLTKWA